MMYNIIESAPGYFSKICEPNVREFLANSSDIRLAFNAVISLNHMRDWCSDTKVALGANEPGMPSEIGIIKDFANNAKHFIVDHTPEVRAGTSAAVVNTDQEGLMIKYSNSDQLKKFGITSLIEVGYSYWSERMNSP